MNKVFILGNLGFDPEMKDSSRGGFLKMRVATTEHWKDATTNEHREQTEVHRRQERDRR